MAQEDLTISLAVANLQADFFNQIKQTVEAEAAERGVEVVTVYAAGDATTQVSQIPDLTTRQMTH
jgi:ribose transport system substrate-binding protein